MTCKTCLMLRWRMVVRFTPTLGAVAIALHSLHLVTTLAATQRRPCRSTWGQLPTNNSSLCSLTATMVMIMMGTVKSTRHPYCGKHQQKMRSQSVPPKIIAHHEAVLPTTLKEWRISLAVDQLMTAVRNRTLLRPEPTFIQPSRAIQAPLHLHVAGAQIAL